MSLFHAKFSAILKTLMVTKKLSGFTIVELLIVIVIIGILAAITVVAYNGTQERSRVQKANSDLNMLVKAIHIGRLNVDKTLIGITGSGCTYCAGTQAAYDQALDRIGVAANMNLSSLKAGDPWGNRYILDENEGEQTSNPCRQDGLNVSDRASHPGIIVPPIPFYNC